MVEWVTRVIDEQELGDSHKGKEGKRGIKKRARKIKGQPEGKKVVLLSSDNKQNHKDNWH